ncbi:MAG: putative PEP-binding protein [Pseudomonadota bacterium]
MVEEIRLTGRPLFGGPVLGRAHLDVTLLEAPALAAAVRTDLDQVERLDTALALVREHLQEHVRSSHLAADEDLFRIMAAHQMVLEDALFFEGIRERIRTFGLGAEEAVEQAFRAVVSRLAMSRDRYLRGRIEDLRDICETLREALLRGEQRFRPHLRFEEDTICVSAELHPSAVLRARQAGAVGFVTSSLAYSSHGVILLRASEIPSVGGVALDRASLVEGMPILLDAERGEVVFRPRPETIATVLGRARSISEPATQAEAHGVVHTRDGKAVTLWANIDNPEQVEQCPRRMLRGVGLLRTEFLVMANGCTPDEEEQVDVYRTLVRALGGCPLILRSFDLGGGKVVASLRHEAGANPSLGLRGLRRHLLLRPEELRTQIRALLRASEGVDATILFPMVTTVDDVVRARTMVLEEADSLAARGVAHNRQLKIASMIEVPAAALHVREILPLVSCVAVGTNDLAQYLAAADRDNAAVSSYLAPGSTGIYRMLRLILDQARELGRDSDVLVGGELASDPEAVGQLLALGVQHLIVIPAAAAAVRRAVAAS